MRGTVPWKFTSSNVTEAASATPVTDWRLAVIVTEGVAMVYSLRPKTSNSVPVSMLTVVVPVTALKAVNCAVLIALLVSAQRPATVVTVGAVPAEVLFDAPWMTVYLTWLFEMLVMSISTKRCDVMAVEPTRIPVTFTDVVVEVAFSMMPAE